MLAGQDDDGLLKQLQADGADQLLLQRRQVRRGLHLLGSVTREVIVCVKRTRDNLEASPTASDGTSQEKSLKPFRGPCWNLELLTHLLLHLLKVSGGSSSSSSCVSASCCLHGESHNPPLLPDESDLAQLVILDHG